MMKNKQNNIDWDLAARVYSGEASQIEVTEFEMWLKYPENRHEWNKISESLNKVDHALVSEKVDIESAWKTVRNKTTKTKASTNQPRIRYFAIAASIIVAVILFLNQSDNTPIKNNNIISQSYNTIEQVNLEDGSVISLNRNSSIEYPHTFTNNSRLVSLKGEAFFNVAADKNHPFIISTDQIKIKVIGTSFNVKAFPKTNQNEVSVNSGSVEVSSLSNTNKKIILHKGDKAIFNVADNSLVKMQLSDNNYKAWKTKEFAFRNEKLFDAIILIEEVYNVTIQIPENFIVENKKISTTFDKFTIEHIIAVLDGIYGVHFRFKEN